MAIPHDGILSQPRYMEEGLNHPQYDATDFDDPPMEGFTFPEEWLGDGMGRLMRGMRG